MSEMMGRLQTDLGERSIYDAASQCSRCGYCEQACPTYVVTGREAFSGRGRNQLVRLMVEGKLKDPQAAREALSTCLLCGACTSACYAHVPTAELVLEGRRMLSERPHWLARLLARWLLDSPARLERLLKAAYLLKRLGLSRLGRPALRLLGLGGLAEADAHVEQAPRGFLREELERMPEAELPAWLYFAPCGPNYLYPRVGLATVAALKALRGPGAFVDNACCGLLAYNYGELADARELARRNIARWERARQAALAAGGKAEAKPPLVADCSSCAAFLKSYPQIFLEEAQWRERAEEFARGVRDAVEILEEEAAGGMPGLAGGVLPTVYHESCRACHGQGLKPPRRLLQRLLGEAWRELPESDVCCGGAGAFSFAHPELSDEVLRRKVGQIAGAQARLVLASSTSCLIQLAHGLKKYYPEASVMHISELAARALQGGCPSGTKAGA